MQNIDKTKPVLVTGGTGYVASWIIHHLLEAGIPVRMSVRNKSAKEKYQHLLEIAEKTHSKLEIIEADLLTEGAFDEAVKGCELVMHTASPFKIMGVKDGQKELVEPALQGTRNVLNAVSNSGTVKRVVLTSSVVAIMGDAVDIEQAPNRIFTEQIWNTTSSIDHQPYSYSKTLAEQEAWKIQSAQDKWDLVIINPGFVLGPSLSKRSDSTSIQLIADMGNGKYKTGVPNGVHGIVDVRDIALAHFQAGFLPEASGRHICVGSHGSFLDIANILKKEFPKYPLPKSIIPMWLMILLGPLFGLTRKYIKMNMGVKIEFDNAYSKSDLKMEYRPVEQTLIEQFQQLLDDGIIKKK